MSRCDDSCGSRIHLRRVAPSDCCHVLHRQQQSMIKQCSPYAVFGSDGASQKRANYKRRCLFNLAGFKGLAICKQNTMFLERPANPINSARRHAKRVDRGGLNQIETPEPKRLREKRLATNDPRLELNSSGVRGTPGITRGAAVDPQPAARGYRQDVR